MRKIQIFLFMTSVLLILPIMAQAQRDVRVEQERYRDYDERNDIKDYIPGGKDWVVLFTYPQNARNVRVIAYGDKEKRVLNSSNTNYNWNDNGRRYVKVLTGSGARKNAQYAGSRNEWARSLRLEYYTPLKPRGERK